MSLIEETSLENSDILEEQTIDFAFSKIDQHRNKDVHPKPKPIRRSSSLGDMSHLRKAAAAVAAIDLERSHSTTNIAWLSPLHSTTSSQIPSRTNSIYSPSSVDSIEDRHPLTFGEFRKFDIYPGKTRNIVKSLVTMSLQDRILLQQKSVNLYKLKLRESKQYNNTSPFLPSFGKLSLFNKFKDNNSIENKPKISNAEKLHVFKMAIRDGQNHIACKIFSELPDSFLFCGDPKVTKYIQSCLLYAMSHDMETLSIIMMEKNIIPDVNAPVFGESRRSATSRSHVLPSWFMVALSFDLDKMLKGMFKKANVNTSWYGLTPLMVACCKGKKTLVKKLLELGADPYEGLDFFRYLKMKRLKVRIDNIDEILFSHIPQEPASEQTSEFKAKQTIAFCDKSLFPIELALACGHIEIYKLLLAKHSGKAIHKSCFGLLLTNEIRIISSLIQMGASVSQQKNFRGANALHLACRRGDLELVVYLLSMDVDVDEPGENGWTPLHEAIAKKHLSIVHYLRLNGADTQKKNDDGETPFDLAKRVFMNEDEIDDYLNEPVKQIAFQDIERSVDSIDKIIPELTKRSSDPQQKHKFLSPKIKQMIGSDFSDGLKRTRSSSTLSNIVSLFK